MASYSLMQAYIRQEKNQKIIVSKGIRTILQLGATCITIVLLIGLSLTWQEYSDQNDIEQELSNETYLELTSNLQNANCRYNDNSLLEPYLECEPKKNKRIKLTYNVLTFNGTHIYYSPFYMFRTANLFNQIKNKN